MPNRLFAAGSRALRWAWPAGYLFVAGSGAAALLWPPASVSHATAMPTVYVWAAFMIVGGGVCAVGNAWDMWLGEYVGLWLLVVCASVFGLAAAGSGSPASRAGSLFLLAVAAWLLGRWRDIAVLRREADRQIRRGR